MSGTTGTIKQPARTGSLIAAVALAASVVAASAAIAWGSANLGKANPAAAPAPITAPAARDLGSRDDAALQAAAADRIHDHGSSELAGVTTGPRHHGGPRGSKANSTSGSNQGASGAGRNLAPRAQ